MKKIIIAVILILISVTALKALPQKIQSIQNNCYEILIYSSLSIIFLIISNILFLKGKNVFFVGILIFFFSSLALFKHGDQYSGIFVFFPVITFWVMLFKFLGLAINLATLEYKKIYHILSLIFCLLMIMRIILVLQII